jgi:hypothetical protein
MDECVLINECMILYGLTYNQAIEKLNIYKSRKEVAKMKKSKFDVGDIVVFITPADFDYLKSKKGKILAKRNCSLILGETNYSYIVEFIGFKHDGNEATEVNEIYLKPFIDNLENGTKVIIRDGTYNCNGVIIGKVWNDNKDQKYAIFFNNPRPNGLQITIQDRKEFVGIVYEN